ncbi:MAG: hypothetical protein ACLGHP_04800, partial [Vicinamibacteria bacterium]
MGRRGALREAREGGDGMSDYERGFRDGIEAAAQRVESRDEERQALARVIRSLTKDARARAQQYADERDAARAEAERLRAELAEAREMACADGECGKCHYCTDAVAWNDNLRAANAQRDLAQAQADEFARQRDRACAALAQMRGALEAIPSCGGYNDHQRPDENGKCPACGLTWELAGIIWTALSSPPDEWLAKHDEAEGQKQLDALAHGMTEGTWPPESWMTDAAKRFVA